MQMPSRKFHYHLPAPDSGQIERAQLFLHAAGIEIVPNGNPIVHDE